jgi:hypothetical protein
MVTSTYHSQLLFHGSKTVLTVFVGVHCVCLLGIYNFNITYTVHEGSLKMRWSSHCYVNHNRHSSARTWFVYYVVDVM